MTIKLKQKINRDIALITNMATLFWSIYHIQAVIISQQYTPPSHPLD